MTAIRKVLQSLTDNGPYLCPGCGKELHYPGACDPCIEAHEADMARDDEARRVLELEAWACIPPKARGWTMETIKPGADPKAFAAVEAWRCGPKGLFLFGEADTGKTFLVWALLKREIREHHRRCLFISMVKLKSQLTSDFRDKRQTAKNMIGRARRAEILVLDDVGVEKQSDWVTEIYFDILDHRINHHLPTVVSSNYSLKKLKKRLEDDPGRVVSRIMGNCGLVPVKGKHYRRLAADQDWEAGGFAGQGQGRRGE